MRDGNDNLHEDIKLKDDGLKSGTLKFYHKEYIKVLILKYPVLTLILGFLLLSLIGVRVWNNYSELPPGDRIFRSVKNIELKGGDDFSFAIFADNKNNSKVFRELLHKVDMDSDISFAIDIGDLVYDGRHRKVSRFVSQVQDNFKKPLLVVIGNHETEDHGREAFTQVFGPYYYSFNVGKILFIMLDDANEESFDGWQLRWLEKELQYAQKMHYTPLLFFHVPLYDPRGDGYQHCLGNSSNAEKFLKICKRYNVRHFFSSHIHGYFSGKWDDIPYIITGGAGAELAGVADNDHYFYHYLKVNVRSSDFDIHLCKLPTPSTGRIGWIMSTFWVYFTGFIYTHIEEVFLFVLMFFIIVTVIIKEKFMC